ncbi:MAG: DUF952 domain-containing protein [Anaerolineales bacterium]|nr:DUF952 domain-containing protein [Anaerolineales bacterium]
MTIVLERGTMIYHIVSKTDWAAVGASDYYRGDTLDTEGFIHCSTLEQVAGTANLFFRGREDLLLLKINPEKLKSPLNYEVAGDGRLFPHIYGPLEVEAVVALADFPPNLDGSFDLPEKYR